MNLLQESLENEKNFLYSYHCNTVMVITLYISFWSILVWIFFQSCNKNMHIIVFFFVNVALGNNDIVIYIFLCCIIITIVIFLPH